MDGVDRSVRGRVHRIPDLFLSHSGRDKTFVRALAEDLAFCEVDVWLDEWELLPGESLHDVVGQALGKSKYVAIVLGDHFSDSRWAGDEMKQALARERRENRVVVLPLLVGDIDVPSFLEDKLFIDLRAEAYFAGVVRLAALINEVPRQHIEESIRVMNPRSIAQCIDTLRDSGFEPYVIVSQEDIAEILSHGGEAYGENRVRFSSIRMAINPNISPRLQRMMLTLSSRVWR